MFQQCDSRVVRKERCPSCQKAGRDRHADNLAVYDDGHTYCFSCGYHTRNYGHNSSPSLSYLSKRLYQQATASPTVFDGLGELTYALPTKAQAWLDKYGITYKEQIDNGIRWSENKQYLILPLLDFNENIIGTNSRYFGDNPKHPKYVNSNLKTGYFKVIKPSHPTSPCFVIVEDIISSIKVGRHAQALALCGSHIPNDLLLRILAYVGNSILPVVVWLDPDKHSESISFSKRFSQYCPSTYVLSEKDPKEHTDKEIIDLLHSVTKAFPAQQGKLDTTKASPEQELPKD